MIKHESVISELVRRNNGLISTDDLRQAGLPRSVLNSLRKRGWRKVHRGLWVAKDGEPTFHEWLQIGQRICGEKGAIGGAAALFLYKVIDREPSQIDFWIQPPRVLRPSPGTPFRFRRDHSLRLDRAGASRQLVTLADALSDFVDESSDSTQAASAIINARRVSNRIYEQVAEVVRDKRQQRHRELLQELLTVAPAYDSVLEYLWITNVEKPHGIPPSIRQWRCEDGFIRDGAWPQLRTIYELDGDKYHLNERVVKRDRRKDNAAHVRGWMTLRFMYADVVHEPCRTAANLQSNVHGLSVHPCGDHCWVRHT